MKKAKGKRQKAKSGRCLTNSIFYFVFFPCLCFSVYAMNFKIQAQSGGNYEITQTVIASGGGQNSANGNFTVDGTIGQSLAGTSSTGGTFNLRGGFWTSSLAPTAATVGLSGKITLDRPGLMQNVRITLQNLSTGVIHSTNPSSFGFYRFEELEIGTYLIQAEGGNFQFNPPSFVISLLDNLDDVNFTGEKIF